MKKKNVDRRCKEIFIADNRLITESIYHILHVNIYENIIKYSHLYIIGNLTQVTSTLLYSQHMNANEVTRSYNCVLFV